MWPTSPRTASWQVLFKCKDFPEWSEVTLCLAVFRMTADDNDFDVFPSEVCLVSRNAKTSSTPASAEKMPSLHKTVKATVLRSLAVLDFSDKARFMMHEEKKNYITGGQVLQELGNGELCFPRVSSPPHWPRPTGGLILERSKTVWKV